MSDAIPSLPQYAFAAWCSVKAQGQLSFIILEHLTSAPSQISAVKNLDDIIHTLVSTIDM
jgi:hypothetical protein